jgi:hypothetical protein
MAQQQFEIEVLSVGSPAFTKTARGGYNSMELAYKNLTFDGKVEGKKLVDFNDKAVFEFLKNSKQGDKVVVTKEKGDADQYWKWTGAEKSSGAPLQKQEASTSSTGSASSTGGVVGRVIGDKRDYETSDERAKKQVYIVKQSSISAALEFHKQNGNSKVTVEEVLHVADQFKNYVFSNNSFVVDDSDIPV